MDPVTDAKDLERELDEILGKDKSAQSSDAEKGKENKPEPTDDQIEKSKSFAKRLQEKTEKALIEERTKIAKMLGKESYDEVLKMKQEDLIKGSGFKPEDINPLVEKLLEQKLENDPRMMRLKELEEKDKQRDIDEKINKELEELKKLTGGVISKVEDIPQEVIADIKQTGSLKTSYLKLKGEELLLKVKASSANGSTNHMNNPGSGNAPKGEGRPLTPEERKSYRFYNSYMSEEDLDKIRIK